MVSHGQSIIVEEIISCYPICHPSKCRSPNHRQLLSSCPSAKPIKSTLNRINERLFHNIREGSKAIFGTGTPEIGIIKYMAGEKILIVEDEKHLVKILKYNLEKEDYRVSIAGDGEAGLALCRHEKPDLVILDVMLPKLDGFEFCKAARQSAKTPILMLTAKTGEIDKVLGLELGAADYVTKPFSFREVLARIGHPETRR